MFTRRVVFPWAMQGIRPQGEFLELGSGAGEMARAMTDCFPGIRVTVTDIDPTMVHLAGRRLARRPDVRVEQADVTELPYDDDSFDYVASFLMLHHVIDWDRALAEASRVLRPGGKLVGYDLVKTRTAQWVHRSTGRHIG